MKIFLLHGDDFLRAKERLNSLITESKQKGFSVLRVSLEGKLNLAEQLSAKSLFETETVYLVENANKIPVDDLKWISRSTEALAGTLIIYNEGFLGARVKGLLPKSLKEEEFKLPPLIFSFLNSFYPGNSSKSVQLLHSLTATEPLEKIVHFLGRHLRDLYWVSRDPSVLPYKQDWRILKTLSQARKFKKGELEGTIGELAEADVVSKTSDNPMIGLLDQIIATRLE